MMHNNTPIDDATKRYLSKTLAYMLRHNQKLTVHKGGFILLDDLMVRLPPPSLWCPVVCLSFGSKPFSG